MAHKHFCICCSAVIAEGEFDCESDIDHDAALCDACVAKLYERSQENIDAGLEVPSGPKRRNGTTFADPQR